MDVVPGFVVPQGRVVNAVRQGIDARGPRHIPLAYYEIPDPGDDEQSDFDVMVQMLDVEFGVVRYRGDASDDGKAEEADDDAFRVPVKPEEELGEIPEDIRGPILGDQAFDEIDRGHEGEN